MDFLSFLFINAGLFLTGLAVLVAVIYWFERVTGFVWPAQDKKKVLPYADDYWKVSGSNDTSDEIEPFRLDVSEGVLEDLRTRLRNTRYGVPSVDGVNFRYGFPPNRLRKVVDYWLNEYDWRKQEDYINQFPQYRTNIEGLNVHFVHVVPHLSSPTTKVFPILLVHGWPGSFFELLKLVPLLTQPRQISENVTIVFEVVIPSLLGFGFSDAAQKPGLEASNMARIFRKMMTRLGFTKYFLHGGDWGSAVCRAFSIMYPESVLGTELTLYPIPMMPYALKSIVAKFLPFLMIDPSEKHKLWQNNFMDIIRESGYLHIQATKPDTVGSSLSDSPAGLAAYILEKFSTWTNSSNVDSPDGNLQEYFSYDNLLTNVMIYWISNCITSSCRLYRENFFAPGGDDRSKIFSIDVPCVLSDFRRELGVNAPKSFLAPYFTDIIAVSKHPAGGHFPAMERPKDVAEDIWLLASTVVSRNLIKTN